MKKFSIDETEPRMARAVRYNRYISSVTSVMSVTRARAPPRNHHLQPRTTPLPPSRGARRLRRLRPFRNLPSTHAARPRRASPVTTVTSHRLRPLRPLRARARHRPRVHPRAALHAISNHRDRVSSPRRREISISLDVPAIHSSLTTITRSGVSAFRFYSFFRKHRRNRPHSPIDLTLAHTHGQVFCHVNSYSPTVNVNDSHQPMCVCVGCGPCAL